MSDAGRPNLSGVDLDPSIRRIVGGRLAWLLRNRNITQRELAEMSGVSRACISRIVSQRRPVTTDALIRICIVLDVPMEWLVGLAPMRLAIGRSGEGRLDTSPYDGVGRREAAHGGRGKEGAQDEEQ